MSQARPTPPISPPPRAPSRLLSVAVQDAFVSKLNADGSALLYSTYLGGSGDDVWQWHSGRRFGQRLCHRLYRFRQFPHHRGRLPDYFRWGSADAFVSKLNADGSALLYSTYLGGSGDDGGNGIARRRFGQRLCHRRDRVLQFPHHRGRLPDHFRRRVQDAFVSKLNADGSALLYSTYLGGSGDDAGNGIARRRVGQRLCHRRYRILRISPPPWAPSRLLSVGSGRGCLCQ